MNKFENWFCGSRFGRFVTERKLLPWILSGYAWEITSWNRRGARSDDRRTAAARGTGHEPGIRSIVCSETCGTTPRIRA